MNEVLVLNCDVWNKMPYEAIAKHKKGVTPAKAWGQKFLKILNFRFRGNDILGVLQLAHPLIYLRHLESVMISRDC